MAARAERLDRDRGRAGLDVVQHDDEQVRQVPLGRCHAPLGRLGVGDARAGLPGAEGVGQFRAVFGRIEAEQAGEGHGLGEGLAVHHGLDDAVLLAAEDEDQGELGSGQGGDQQQDEAAAEAARPEAGCDHAVSTGPENM
jgi:hypothetical protein